MYCPGCGSDDRQMSQYCRACGTDLRPVRLSLENPDAITASAVSAREDIGRAVAAKIREIDDADELKHVAEDVLPQIEKFLESYEEKRLRRVRAGVITASSGLGVMLLGMIMSAFLHGPDVEKAILIGGLGIIAFAIGLGILVNGLLFTRPRKALSDHSAEGRAQNVLDAYAAPQISAPVERQSFRAPTTSDFSGSALRTGTSVTEQTTRHLKPE